MSFQSSVFRDGEWVTESRSLADVLKDASSPKAASKPQFQAPPTCGILSRTIIESPVVQWVLPVRLRSSSHNDIAFIGSNFVQISELQQNGEAHEILKKSNFDSRIRNALIFGRGVEQGLDESNSLMSDGPSSQDTHSLPPQMLVLILESGDLVFMFIKVSDQGGSLEFITKVHKGPRNVAHLGYHLAIDPSSRYMAAVSPDRLLVVYELESMETLNEQLNHGHINPVKSMWVRSIQGVIHKAEFLYPRVEDEHHIILLLSLAQIKRGHSAPASRIAIYEWELGENLDDAFSVKNPGIRLHADFQLPLLVIPIKSKSSFLMVSQECIGLVTDALSGSPSFTYLPTAPPSRTKQFHGRTDPLWTTWARAFRPKEFYQNTDFVYLVREDGAVQGIEIDVPSLFVTMINVGCLDTNIDTGFTTSFDGVSDVLIATGDSGPGGIWKWAPRKDLQRASVLPNWSPVVDATACPEIGTIQRAVERRIPSNAKSLFLGSETKVNRDRLFTTSGRGLQGAVTEWHWGARARVGLDLDVGEPTRQAWAFFTDSPSGGKTLGVILAVPHSSAALTFSEDLDHVNAMPAVDTQLDLLSTTLATHQTADGSIIQISEKFITIVSGTNSARESFDSILGVQEVDVQSACCSEKLAVVAYLDGSSSQLHAIDIDPTRISRQSTWEIQGEVSCMVLLEDSDNPIIVAGSRHEGASVISLFMASGETIMSVPLSQSHDSAQFDALTSICAVHQDNDTMILSLGTRCGSLITFHVSGRAPENVKWVAEKLGAAPVEVFPANNCITESPAAFVCSDGNLTMLGDFSTHDLTFKSHVPVRPTDSNDDSMVSPPIHAVHRLGQNLSQNKDQMSLLLLSGSRILLAELHPHVGAVPRVIPVGGTPTRVIYSKSHDCLVVAVLSDNRPTLAFVDPDSGTIMSEAIDKNGKAMSFVKGLGQIGDRIMGLSEWVHVKNNKTYAFILVATKASGLVIVSANLKMGASASLKVGGSAATVKEQVVYHTRNILPFEEPVNSVASDADGIVICVGNDLYWVVLDMAEKRLKPTRLHQLQSPATVLQIRGKKIFALTTNHSMQVIEMTGGTMTLLHADSVGRPTTHMIDAASSAESDGQGQLHLLSDMQGGVIGVIVPWGHRTKEFSVIFEARLPCTVRRFVKMRSRRTLSKGYGRYGTLPTSTDDTEIFGLSLSGSLQHFTLLSDELWQLLRLIQTRIEVQQGKHRKSRVSDLPRPDQMHIRGDFIETCLRRRMLEEIIGEEQIEIYQELLDSLDNGAHRWPGDASDDLEEKKKRYFSLGYEVLEYVCAPVL